MSQEAVEIIEAAIDAANCEDWDAVVQAAAPGFELDMSRSQSFAARPCTEPHEFIEVGDLMVVPQTTHVRGRDGIEVVSRPTLVWTIRDGAIERVSMYQERQDALEAVGLG